MEIKIYTYGNCQYCAAAKRLLEKRQLAYTQTELCETTLEELSNQTGQSTTPFIFIDGQHIGGFDDLVDIDQDGGLAPPGV